jgi:hypothetical protein
MGKATRLAPLWVIAEGFEPLTASMSEPRDFRGQAGAAVARTVLAIDNAAARDRAGGHQNA